MPVMRFTSLNRVGNPLVNNSHIVTPLSFCLYTETHRRVYICFTLIRSNVLLGSISSFQKTIFIIRISFQHTLRGQAMCITEILFAVSLQSLCLVFNCYSSFKVASLTAADFSITKGLSARFPFSRCVGA